MTIKNLKQYLIKLDKKKLQEEIIRQYKTFKVIKQYYDSKLNPNEINEIIKNYKAILEKQFCPKLGLPKLDYSTARKAINDFKKICLDPYYFADLQLTYVEYVVSSVIGYIKGKCAIAVARQFYQAPRFARVLCLTHIFNFFYINSLFLELKSL